MTHRNVEILIGKLATDPALGKRFASDRRAVLDELRRQGFELTTVELDALSSTGVEAFQTLTSALDRRLRKAPIATPTSEETTMTFRTEDPATASRGERVIRANGVEIAAEAFGDPSQPTLLLPQGACYSMLRYPAEQCERLAAAGLQVIRYDNRDTGRSTAYPPLQPGYTLQDMALDAVAVLDAYGVEKAHFLGASQGGMISQIAAIQNPERVASLTLLMSTPDPSPIVGHFDGATTVDPLPPPTQAVIDMIQFLGTVDWSSLDAATEGMLIEARVLAGSRFPIDENEVRGYAAAEFRRARCLHSSRVNHGAAQHQSPRWRHRIGSIVAPTLVIHGSEDPILPLPHGIALAQEIPGAELFVVEGMGHDATAGVWDVIRETVLSHLLSGVHAASA